MRHARQFDIADVKPTPLHQPVEIRPRYRLADIGIRPVEHRKRLGIQRGRCHCPLPCPRLRGALDRIDNRLIAGAAAIIAGKMLANLFAIRHRGLFQQILRRHQHSRRTEATLQGVAIAERCLQIGDLAAVGQPFDRFDRTALHLYRQNQTGAHDLAVDAYGARAANPVLTTDMRAG